MDNEKAFKIMWNKRNSSKLWCYRSIFW